MKQSEALTQLKDGQSCFITGEAGTGKTHLLREFTLWAKDQGKKVAVTASTGIAATHLGGRTIHSWSGMGIADSFSSRLVSRMKDARKIAIEQADILIIDEVSLLSAAQIDVVERILQQVRGSIEPFGGLQLVLSGDLFQLPPIVRRDEDKIVELAHKSRIFIDQEIAVCYLTEQFRQDEVNPLHQLLGEIRSGEITEFAEGIVNELLEASRNQKQAEQVSTKLFPFNAAVDDINARELAKIAGAEKSYDMMTSGETSSIATLQKGCIALPRLLLKIGAPVMFIKNDVRGRYVNGTQGRVVDFDKKSNLPIVQTDEARIKVGTEIWEMQEGEETVAALSQIPLRLAWAITIHKSQGMTLDRVEVDLSRSFVPGMGYVALSRLRSIEGLTLNGVNNVALQVSKQALEADLYLRELEKHQ